jgi:hypothetical protein
MVYGKLKEAQNAILEPKDAENLLQLEVSPEESGSRTYSC